MPRPPDPLPGVLSELLRAPALRRRVNTGGNDARRGLLEGAERAPGSVRKAESGSAREEEGERPEGESSWRVTEERREGPVKEARCMERNEELGMERWG